MITAKRDQRGEKDIMVLPKENTCIKNKSLNEFWANDDKLGRKWGFASCHLQGGIPIDFTS